MRFLPLLVALSVIAHHSAPAAELRHYHDALALPYDPDVYQMEETALTHDSYRLYTLSGSLKAFKRRNSEREGTIRFNIAFANVIKFDTVEAWITESRRILALNQKQGNEMVEVGAGTLGAEARYRAVVDTIVDDGRFGIIEYDVGYIRLGRMLTMQIFFQGDTTNDIALQGFTAMANDLLHQVVDGDAKPFTGSLALPPGWRDLVKPRK
jgi:hypothetical protein